MAKTIKTRTISGLVHRIGVNDVQIKLSNTDSASLKVLPFYGQGIKLSGFLGEKVKFTIKEVTHKDSKGRVTNVTTEVVSFENA